MVFESTDGDVTQVLIHDRADGSTTAVPDPGAQNPSISGNGCFVTYSTFTPAVIAPTTTESTTTTTTTTTVPKDAATGSTSSTSSSSTSSTDAPVVVDAGATGGDSVSAGLQAAQTADSPATSTVHAFDRCADPVADTSVVVRGPVDVTEALPAAAISADGVVVAVSDGDDIFRYTGTLSGYTLDTTFDTLLVASPAQVTGRHLDVSADGSVVVFEAGTDLTPDDDADDGDIEYGVYAYTHAVAPSVATIRAIASNSTDPSITADGGLIAFESGTGSNSTFTGVVLQTSDPSSPAVNISIDPAGSEPMIAANGGHVVYNTGVGTMAMTTWVGDTANPFEAVDIVDLSAAVSGAPATTFAVSGPVVAADGGVVAYDAGQAATAINEVAVRTLPTSGSFDASLYDLGSGEIGETITATVTFTNQGPASVGVAVESVVAEAPFEVVENACIGSVRPGTSCTIDVSLTVTDLEDVFGSVTLTGTDGVTTSAELSGLGAAVTTTPTPTASTVPANTTTQNTTRVTTRNTTRTTTRVTTRNTTSNTTRNTTSSSATTLPTIALTPVFEPATFDFAPTIAEAGRRTASIELVNPGGSTETLSSATFADPAAGFSVVDTTCTDLTTGSRCTVNIAFAPSSEGALTGEVVARFASGAEARATITGVGAAAPTLTVIPGVATVGQVVTVQGAGFPAGATVKLTFGDEATSRDVVVNDTGVFNLPLVVLPNTASGPLTVKVEGQTDVFGDTETEMLVTATSSRKNPAVLGTLGARIGS